MNFIQLRSNGLCIENISALKLTKKYQTPFYCYSLAQLRNNFLKGYSVNNNQKGQSLEKLRYSIDLIVMGTNGKDSMADYILGSTSSNIVSKSHVPVLSVPIIG